VKHYMRDALGAAIGPGPVPRPWARPRERGRTGRLCVVDAGARCYLVREDVPCTVLQCVTVSASFGASFSSVDSVSCNSSCRLSVADVACTPSPQPDHQGARPRFCAGRPVQAPPPAHARRERLQGFGWHQDHQLRPQRPCRPRLLRDLAPQATPVRRVQLWSRPHGVPIPQP
jgi:hypothetical protein